MLEGIALVGNPDFAIVDEAYPYIAQVTESIFCTVVVFLPLLEHGVNSCSCLSVIYFITNWKFPLCLGYVRYYCLSVKSICAKVKFQFLSSMALASLVLPCY